LQSKDIGKIAGEALSHFEGKLIGGYQIHQPQSHPLDLNLLTQANDAPIAYHILLKSLSDSRYTDPAGRFVSGWISSMRAYGLPRTKLSTRNVSASEVKSVQLGLLLLLIQGTEVSATILLACVRRMPSSQTGNLLLDI